MRSADIHYFLDCFAALVEMRGRGRRLFDSFVRRMVSEAGLDALTPAQATPASTPSKRNPVWEFLRNLPRYSMQKKEIAESRKTGVDLFVGITSSRLFGGEASGELRPYLSRLAQTFPSPHPGASLGDEIQTSARLYLCDPVPHSPLWERRAEFGTQGVFIVDVGFAAYLGLGWGLAWDCARIITPALRRFGWRALIPLCLTTLLLRGYARLSDGRSNLRLLLFTCNSLAVEALRWHLLQNPRCRFICEILHGIPTTEVEKYFADLLDKQEQGSKHYFIPQLPLPLSHGIFRHRLIGEGQIAINSYFNRQPINSDFLTQQHQTALSHLPSADKTLIVSFIGGTSHDRDFFESDAHRVERALLAHLKKTLRADGRPHLLLYAPHPAHPATRFSESPFFREHGIRICPSTIFTWFVSDVSLSLLSSAMFEAAYFDVASFTPLNVADEVYSEALLERLHYSPGDTRAFLEKLDSVLVSQEALSASAILPRAIERLNRLNVSIQPASAN